MIFFTVNPIILGEVLTAKKYAICWNITTYKNMDVKLLHPVWKNFLDTVNTVVLTRYWKQLIIFLFDVQCFFQSGSECGPWTNSCLVIQKIHLDFLWFFYFQCKSMVEYMYILVCSLYCVILTDQSEWIRIYIPYVQYIWFTSLKQTKQRSNFISRSILYVKCQLQVDLVIKRISGS
jgi:hypothetical protein